MASTMRSTSASADSFCDRRARVMSRSGSMPNVSRMASAMVSAPLPGASVDTRLPRRSLTDLMPDSFSTTKCCGAGYIWNSATISSGCSKGGRPWCALYATLPSTMPISDKPLPTRRAFSTDAAVDSAVTMTPGMWRDKRSAIAPPSGKYTPPGPPVDRLRNRVCAPAAAANTPTISKAANTTDRLRTFDLCTLSTSCSVLIPRQRQQATFPKGVPLRRIPPIDVLGTVIQLLFAPQVLAPAQHLQGTLLIVQGHAQNQRVDQAQRRDEGLDEGVEIGHRRQRDVGELGQRRHGVVRQHDGGNPAAVGVAQHVRGPPGVAGHADAEHHVLGPRRVQLLPVVAHAQVDANDRLAQIAQRRGQQHRHRRRRAQADDVNMPGFGQHGHGPVKVFLGQILERAVEIVDVVLPHGLQRIAQLPDALAAGLQALHGGKALPQLLLQRPLQLRVARKAHRGGEAHHRGLADPHPAAQLGSGQERALLGPGHDVLGNGALVAAHAPVLRPETVHQPQRILPFAAQIPRFMSYFMFYRITSG